MISRLPRWVWAGAWVLAFVAGSINVVGLLGFERQAVTHLTGTTSLLGEAISRGDGGDTLHLLALLGSFVAGCALSGFIIRDSTLRLGRRYGVALALESLLLLVATTLLSGDDARGLYAAACACGLQNAMVSTYSGSVVRTTHVSGMFTDLGIFLGHALRRMPVDGRRMQLSIVVITGFLAGGIAGASLYREVGARALLFPAALTLGVAFAYTAYRFWRAPGSDPAT